MIDSVSSKKGEIHLLKDDKKVKRNLNAKTQSSTKFAVLVMNNQDKHYAKQAFNTPLVFSIQEAKGLEYANVILFNFVSCEEQKYHEIAKGISSEDLTLGLTYSRAKDKSDHSLEIYKFYINALYVAITRAIDNLYIIEDHSKHSLIELLGLKNVSSIALTKDESSLEEWRQEARKLDI